jgi:hypothetical protein
VCWNRRLAVDIWETLASISTGNPAGISHIETQVLEINGVLGAFEFGNPAGISHARDIKTWK